MSDRVRVGRRAGRAVIEICITQVKGGREGEGLQRGIKRKRDGPRRTLRDDAKVKSTKGHGEKRKWLRVTRQARRALPLH